MRSYELEPSRMYFVLPARIAGALDGSSGKNYADRTLVESERRRDNNSLKSERVAAQLLRATYSAVLGFFVPCYACLRESAIGRPLAL